MSNHLNNRRPIITLALVTSGTLLALSGLSMLSWPAAPLLTKGWSLLGLSSKGIGTVHQVSAVAFLSSAGTHIFDRRHAVARHIKTVAMQPGSLSTT